MTPRLGPLQYDMLSNCQGQATAQGKTNTKLTFPQRNLNNCFAYDLVPSPSVLTAAVRAARRVNDFPSAVRVFEGTYSSTATTVSVNMHMCTFWGTKPYQNSPL